MWKGCSCRCVVQAPGQMPNISVYFTCFGVITSVISTFLSSGFKR